ncbi:MAG: lysophospholipid acyltransferase family protein [Candidatus Riflebacteria bacterium]|jgi:KDO2-lipid IV(A) lauroyltransferase|nr:lysophospholipid acyltransferase family protein [Candidatus Riflebacteria bacterium]
MLRDKLKNFKRTIRYYLLRNLVAAMTRLPATAVPKLKRLFMKVFPMLFAKELRRAEELLPPEFNSQKQQILKMMTENQVQTILEVFFYEKLLQHNPEFIKVSGREYLEEAQKKGKGMIILSAHFGNWEVMGYELRKMGLPLHVLARPQAVNQMTEFMNGFRERRGVKVIMEKSISESLKLLAQGKTVGMLSDLNAREWGYQVEFFGRNASFYSSPVILSVRSGAPLIPSFTERQADGSLLLRFEKPITWEKGETMRQRVQKYVRRYEQAFRRRPDHWCWFHPRYEFASLGRTS